MSEIHQPVSGEILWDGFGFSNPNSGVYVHAQSLYQELRTLDLEPEVIGEKNIDFSSKTKILPPLHAGKVANVKAVWNLRLGMLIRSMKKKPKIFHGLSNIDMPMPKIPGLKLVVTIHDVIPLLANSGTSMAQSLQYRSLLPAVIKQADALVCVSQWTADSVVSRWPEARSKIIVIPNGLQPSQPRSRTQPHKIAKILYIARAETYKNLSMYFSILRECRGTMTGTLLTDARGLGLAEREAKDLISSGVLAIQMQLSESELEKLWNDTDVYVHVSQYEGFCLPAAEAMVRGVPVIYQSGHALDEWVGPAGYGIPGKTQPKMWITKIKDLAPRGFSPDFQLALKQHLTTLPTWKNAASQLKKLYTELMNCPN